MIASQKIIFTVLTNTLLVALVCAGSASAQNSSLMHAPMPTSVEPPRSLNGQIVPRLAPAPGSAAASQPNGFSTSEPMADRPTVLIDRASWTYQPAPPIRTFQKNDLVTIRVDEITRVQADGAANQRKQTLYEAILTDWIKLSDFKLGPDAQADGDPTAAATSAKNYRAQSTIQSRESMTFNIAAQVVDIRPNGSLVLEARKSIRVNDNLWETSLTGVCRAQDIAPDNVVLSKDLIDLEIHKEDQGHLRDGYKRGWLARWLDRVSPF